MNDSTKMATLREATIAFDENGEPGFMGKVYNDPEDRFIDGQVLRIGPLLEEGPAGVFRTPTGVYKVELLKQFHE